MWVQLLSDLQDVLRTSAGSSRVPVEGSPLLVPHLDFEEDTVHRPQWSRTFLLFQVEQSSGLDCVLVSPLQVQTVLKKVPVPTPNQTEPIIQSKKALEYKWGMNVLGECP